MSYRSGRQMFAIMTNWKTEFHKPLTRPGVKRDEEMSICSPTPQAHRGYINSSLLESDLKMSESHANVVSFDENVSSLSNLYERNEHLLMNETTVENMTTIRTIDDDAKPKNFGGARCDREPSRLQCKKIIKMFKKSKSSRKCIKRYIGLL